MYSTFCTGGEGAGTGAGAGVGSAVLVGTPSKFCTEEWQNFKKVHIIDYYSIEYPCHIIKANLEIAITCIKLLHEAKQSAKI